MADMSELLKNFSSLMENDQIPDNVKEFMKSIKNNTNNTNNKDTENINTNIDNPASKPNQNNIDIETLMKFQKIINAMNSSPDSSGANLLRSLKPYLNKQRQEKVEEYVKLMNFEKFIKIFHEYGGDKNIGL